MSCNSFSGIFKVTNEMETKELGGHKMSRCRAVNKFSFKDESDLWVDLEFWGKRGESAGKYIKKLDSLFIKGTLQSRMFKEKIYLSVNVDDFHWVNTKAQNGEDYQKSDKNTKVGEEVEAVKVEVDNEIPF